MKISFWGCPMQNFRDDLPFHGMRPAYAAFEKEIPMALKSTVGFFQNTKVLQEYQYFTVVVFFPACTVVWGFGEKNPPAI